MKLVIVVIFEKYSPSKELKKKNKKILIVNNFIVTSESNTHVKKLYKQNIYFYVIRQIYCFNVIRISRSISRGKILGSHKTRDYHREGQFEGFLYSLVLNVSVFYCFFFPSEMSLLQHGRHTK